MTSTSRTVEVWLEIDDEDVQVIAHVTGYHDAGSYWEAPEGEETVDDAQIADGRPLTQQEIDRHEEAILGGQVVGWDSDDSWMDRRAS